MRVHRLNCGAMRPPGGWVMDGASPLASLATLGCCCLVLETVEGLVLVDTGIAGTDPAAARRALHPVFRAIDLPDQDPAQSAAAQLRRLGLDPGDVRHIVMTHMDFDHAAGLRDFPGAQVHLSAQEAAAATRPESVKASARYRPAQWGSTQRWRPHDMVATWFGLPAAPVLGSAQTEDEVLLVSLPGHTRGHCGVAIRRDQGWLLHAGDAIFFRSELARPPRMPGGSRAYQWMMETSQLQRRRSLRAVRQLVATHGAHLEVICTHDPSLISPLPQGSDDHDGVAIKDLPGYQTLHGRSSTSTR